VPAPVRRVSGIAVASLYFLAANVFSAESGNSRWYARSWESADGLPDNEVTGVAQTPDGYLWTATAGGLLRFDGIQFQEFPLMSLEGLPNRVVRAMTMDHAGGLWLGMDRGPVICVASDGARAFTKGLRDSRIVQLAGDEDDAIWIAYADGNLNCLKDGRVASLAAPADWPTVGAPSLATDRSGQLWVAKSRKVGLLRHGQFQTVLDLPVTAECLAAARNGGVWLCGGRQLLRVQTNALRLIARLPVEPNGMTATTALEESAGAIWIGTAADGLFRCDGTNTEAVPTSYAEITSLAEDREGNIWAGTGGGGLNRLRPRVIELLGRESGLPYESVRSVCVDDAGAIWVATQNGLLARRDKDQWTTVNEVTRGFFACVASSRRGGVWAGTRDAGFYYIGGGHSDHWDRSQGLSSDNVRSIFEASNGDVFIGCDGPSRLDCLRDGQVCEFNSPVRHRSLRAMTQDREGRVWVGSADGMLFCVEGERLLNRTPVPTNRLLSIRCLAAAPDGGVLIGYAGWGLGWLSGTNFGRVAMEQGLPDDYISQMAADGRGWLWCAGNRGLFEVRLNELSDAARNPQARVTPLAYARGEGYPNLQANYDNMTGALRAADGRLLFPMRTGLAIVHPGRVAAHGPSPPVVLQSMIVDDRAVDIAERSASIELPPDFRKLQFQFAALSFVTPENVRFQYRLGGWEDDWQDSGTLRQASYSRLPHATYRFEVRACNADGVWGAPAPSLAFVVAPFYWQTMWFRAGAAALFTVTLASLVRYVSLRRLRRRLRSLEQEAALQRERARIAKDIHDDVGANLTQIAFLGELARQDQAEPEKAVQRMGEISTTARQAIKSLDEIVWAVNPRNDTLAHLIDYAGQFAVDYLQPTGIRCRVDFPDTIPDRELSTDLRHNLFLAVKEALQNVVKHSRAREVNLRARLTDEQLELILRDDGCGFHETPENALADGLRNMRQRLTDIGGRCRWESAPGAGTAVIIELPWAERNGGRHRTFVQ